MSHAFVLPFLSKNPVFRRDEIQLFVAEAMEEAAAYRFCRSFLGQALRKGRIASIRNGLYGVVEPVDGTIDPLLIAGKASADAVIGFQTALHMHTRMVQPKTVHFYSATVQDGWRFREHQFSPVRVGHGPLLGQGLSAGVETLLVQGIPLRVTTPERTLVDILDRLDLVGDPIAVWQLLPLLATASRPFQWPSLLAYLRRLQCTSTSARVGYFLSGHLSAFGLQSSDLLQITDRPRHPHPWGPPATPQEGIVDPAWNLRIPDSFRLDCPGISPDQRPELSRLKISSDLSSSALETHLRLRFGRHGIPRFRQGQEQIVRAVLEGRDAFAVLPTGAGKSLTYQFPATLLRGVTLVLSPLIALMADQVVDARKKGIVAFALRSPSADSTRRNKASASKPPNGTRLRRRSMDADWNNYAEIRRSLAAGALDLLFLAPESLNRAMRMFPDLRQQVSQIVVDEAHVIHEWGWDFRSDYKELGRVRNLFPGVPVLALTATANDVVRNRILQTLDLKDFVETRFSVVRTRLFLRRHCVSEGIAEKRRVLIQFIQAQNGSSGIVYCPTRPQTEGLAAHLRDAGIHAMAYHAGMTYAQRQRAQNAFMRNKCMVMVATIAFGMGLNKPDVRYVVHFGLPRSMTGYVQEIGRAGRDAQPAECFLIHSKDDVWLYHRWIRDGRRALKRAAASSDKASTDERKNRLREREADLLHVETYAHTSICLHQLIASHFQEDIPPCESACEPCKQRFSTPDQEESGPPMLEPFPESENHQEVLGPENALMA